MRLNASRSRVGSARLLARSGSHGDQPLLVAQPHLAPLREVGWASAVAASPACRTGACRCSRRDRRMQAGASTERHGCASRSGSTSTRSRWSRRISATTMQHAGDDGVDRARAGAPGSSARSRAGLGGDACGTRPRPRRGRARTASRRRAAELDGGDHASAMVADDGDVVGACGGRQRAQQVVEVVDAPRRWRWSAPRVAVDRTPNSLR